MAKDENRYNRKYNGVKIDVKAKSVEEKWAAVARKKYEIDNFITTSSTMKFSDWVKQYLSDYKKPAVSPEWYHEIEKLTKGMIDELGPFKLRDIKPVHLQRTLNRYRGMSLSYRKKAYTTLREIFRLAYENSLIPDITKGLALPEGKDDLKRRSITESERDLILKVSEYHPFGLFVRIMLYCGLRPSEVKRLKWMDITDVINVQQSKSKAGIRKVPVPKAFKFHKGNPFDYVCTKMDGKSPMTKATVDTSWKRFKEEMQRVLDEEAAKAEKPVTALVSPSLTLYCMRHTYCTDLEKKGVPINIASRLMGHASISITSKIYTHFDDDTLEMARKIIDGETKSSGKQSGKKPAALGK